MYQKIETCTNFQQQFTIRTHVSLPMQTEKISPYFWLNSVIYLEPSAPRTWRDERSKIFSFNLHTNTFTQKIIITPIYRTNFSKLPLNEALNYFCFFYSKRKYLHCWFLFIISKHRPNTLLVSQNSSKIRITTSLLGYNLKHI